MKFNNSEPQSPFQNVTLKRNKDAFRTSASMFSTAQATNKMNTGNENIFKDDNRETLNPKQQYQRKSERKSYSKIKMFKPQIPKLQQTPIFKNLSNLINQQKQINRNSSSFMQNRTHCYTSSGTLGQDYNIKYQITNQQNFPPPTVKEVYDRQMTKSVDGNVNYHFGNLQKSGYLYFCVEKTLMLLNSLYYVSSQLRQDLIIIDIPQHALSVKQLIVADFEVQDIERHPFGQRQIILLVWFQWSVGFYSFEPRGLVKLIDLDMRFETSCQAAFLFDYCKNGNLYYMNQSGEMGKIELFHKNFWNFWSRNRKFSMKQYFYRLKNETKRKHQKLLYTGFFQKLKQFYLDTKYWWSTKKTKGLSITCDRELDLLYTLVQTSVKQNIGLNKSKKYTHKQIRMYGLFGNHTKLNILQRIQSEIYMNPPKLLKQLTEQNLYAEIGAHLFNNLTLQKFQISGIHVPYSFTNSHLQYGRYRSNLLIVLRNGSRIYLYLSSDKLILNQMINLPNLDNLISLQRRNISFSKNYEPLTIAQRQPDNFLLVRHKFNFKDKSLALIGIYRRTLITLLFSQPQEEDNNSVEEVQILWEISLQQDSQGTPSKNMFFNPSDYRLMLGPQFQDNLYKRKLGKYKYDQVQIISKISQEGNQKIKSKTEQIRNNTIKQSPLSRQILHYPQQYLFINQDKIRGVTKLRPIDILLSTLQKQITSHTEASINSLMFSDFELGAVLKKIQNNLKIKEAKIQRLEILAMFVQIYCDIDGVYYFDQLSDNFGKRQSTSNDQRKSINLNNEDQRKTSSQRFSNNFQNSTNDLQNDGESYHERLKRYTQKFNKITSFRKYRHSDLINMQNFAGTNRFDASPLKQDRSDHSVMKLILKLTAFMMKSVNNQKARQYYDEISKQTGWIPAATKAPSNFIASPQIQQAALIYLSRLLVPVWALKLKSIQNIIFPYLSEICQKIIEFIKRLQYELTMVSLSSSFQQLHDLCARTIEYNMMLSVLSNPPALKYGEGMGASRQIFEQAIFYSLQREKNISKSVNQWRQLMPNYFNLNLLKTITLQAQISNISKVDQKKQVILNNYKFMPHYLLYCYYRDGTLTKSQIQSLIQLNESRKGQFSLKNVNHLVNADSMDPLQKVKYAVSEIYKNSNNLQQKQFLIVYAKQNVNNIRNQRESQVQNIKKQVNRLQKVLKIQQLILKELQRYEDQNPDQKIDDKTKKLINNYLLTPSHIKKLIAQLKKPIIQLIYYCCFWDIDIDVEKTLRQLLFDSRKRLRKSSEIRQILKDIFQMTSVANVNKPPLTPLLRVLDELAFSQLNKTNLQEVISKNNQQFMKEKLWVPLFLAEWGWNKSMILDYYIEQSQKYFKYFESLASQQSFLYSWLSAYVLTKFKHIEGRRIFQVANESILKLGQVQRNSDLQNQIKLLIDFIRQNLAY